MNAISKKPSTAITQALDDLRKVERNKKYRVDMDVWHDAIDLEDDWGEADQCVVCLAGATMAKTLNKAPTDALSPSSFNRKVKNQLLGLDEFRTGRARYALKLFGVRNAPYDFDREIADYETDRLQFYRDLRKLARDLRQAGY